MFRRKPNKRPRIDTLIGTHTRIDGDVEFSGGLHVDGYINGNVRGSRETGATLSVSETGGIEGSVAVDHIVLNGLVKGDINATGRVELGSKAQVLGNVHYSVIETAVGAQIKGQLVHGGAAPAADRAPDSDGGPDGGQPL